MNINFWRNKRVLITGHTGFKGSWLALLLQSMAAEVVGIALEPPTQPNLFSIANVSQQMTSIIGNINDLELLKSLQNLYQPEIVFHLAAQPLVRYSYHNPIETYTTNVMGTVNVLESIRQAGTKVKAVVIVTSDKCYENKEWCWPYREQDPLGGYDPYSNSKACAELVSAAYRNSYSMDIATVRAGNVIGGGDWAQDRLVPDIIRSIEKTAEIIIRYPQALRPWQHVLEPLQGYLQLAEKMYHQPAQYGEAWNFGPSEADVRSVQWLVEKIIQIWNTSITWKTTAEQQLHEAGYLKLDSSKAKTRLAWQPRWEINKALRETVQWYKAYQSGANMREITLSQIKQYFINEEVLV
jgi:CDP-glucose 4,6-dehydratase